MKKLLVLVLSLVFCGMGFTMAYADTDGNAIANVYVTVDPNIAIQAPSASVSAGTTPGISRRRSLPLFGRAAVRGIERISPWV